MSLLFTCQAQSGKKVLRVLENPDRFYFSSSLQRIELTNVRLERRFSEIGAMIERFGTDNSQGPPTISATGGGMALISSMFMRNAEIGQRRWGSIGVDEWIQAGKWWLMKVGFSGALHHPLWLI